MGQPSTIPLKALLNQPASSQKKLGLLDANHGYLRQKWGEAGLLEFEFADDTGSDYETYDAVAADRAAASAARAADSAA